MISQEVMSHFEVFYSFMQDWIFGSRDDIGVVAHEGNSLEDHSKISHGAYNSKDLGAAATYSVSIVDWVIEDYFQEDQQTRENSRKWQVPEELFRSIPLLAKLASKKPTRSNEEEEEYQIPNSRVCLRYLKIHWTAWRCEVHGES
jgi:hypothetical protein